MHLLQCRFQNSKSSCPAQKSCATRYSPLQQTTNLAGCTEVNGKSTSHKYVPGTGLLLGLVAVLINDVHGKWTAGSAGRSLLVLHRTADAKQVMIVRYTFFAGSNGLLVCFGGRLWHAGDTTAGVSPVPPKPPASAPRALLLLAVRESSDAFQQFSH
jgi:hypothetical protein